MGEMINPGLTQADFDLAPFHAAFFDEAGDNLDSMESLLLAMDSASVSDDDLNAVFRVAHSIKGGAATFGFADVTALTHEMETLLDRLRRHELVLRPEMVDALLQAGDVLRGLLARHRNGGGEAVDASALAAWLKALASGSAPPPAAVPVLASQRVLRLTLGPLPDAGAVDGVLELFRDIGTLGSIEAADGGALSPSGHRMFKVVTSSPEAELTDLFSFHVSADQVAFERWVEAGVDLKVTGEPPRADAADGGADGVASPRARASARAAVPVASAAAASESGTLRVAVDKIDQLINLVGELVITQSMLAQQTQQFDPVRHGLLVAGMAELERTTRHLQESVMSIRMIPMSVVFSRFPRMIRDLGARLGKQLELQLAGEATELDKGLIEKIIDPLTHLVRNSADHGIEAPTQRLAAGKAAQGSIRLSAVHQGGSILIEVADDGAGLSRRRILDKARSRGLPARDDMTDAEVWALIWEPGFSTAETLSDVSGRGVGMDVVKRNIADLGGSVELHSIEGQGTRVSIRLPLTLAIMDGMLIGVGGETYVLPLASVVESFQLRPGRLGSIAGGGQVVHVREDYLPVVALDDLLDLPDRDSVDGAGLMVTVEAEGHRIALRVDELLGQQQVVVKNLERNYRRVPNVSGATILGDGRVALIIDVIALVRRMRH
jgi:two-component system chemotaxis sensor kinase CheA